MPFNKYCVLTHFCNQDVHLSASINLNYFMQREPVVCSIGLHPNDVIDNNTILILYSSLTI